MGFNEKSIIRDSFLLKILIKPAVARPASPFVPVSDRSYLVGV